MAEIMAWIKENWEKIDDVVLKVIDFLRNLLGAADEWPIV